MSVESIEYDGIKYAEIIWAEIRRDRMASQEAAVIERAVQGLTEGQMVWTPPCRTGLGSSGPILSMCPIDQRMSISGF